MPTKQKGRSEQLTVRVGFGEDLLQLTQNVALEIAVALHDDQADDNKMAQTIGDESRRTPAAGDTFTVYPQKLWRHQKS